MADEHFAVNARSYALMMSEYIRRYLERGASWGRIINISTDAAHTHLSSISYAATKHAIESYSRSAALEVGKYGITFNIVAPGPIQTGYLTPEQEASISKDTPLRRCGMPEDVAEVIVLLASTGTLADRTAPVRRRGMENAPVVGRRSYLSIDFDFYAMSGRDLIP